MKIKLTRMEIVFVCLTGLSLGIVTLDCAKRPGVLAASARTLAAAEADPFLAYVEDSIGQLRNSIHGEQPDWLTVILTRRDQYTNALATTGPCSLQTLKGSNALYRVVKRTIEVRF